MYCPLTTSASGYWRLCKECECAWYNENTKECAVKTLTILTTNVLQDITDGSKTIYTREV